MKALTLVLAALTLAAFAPTAIGATAKNPWPPMTGAGDLFVHYGEEHWNDDDGLNLLPKIVAESARYKPALVTMSGDKDNDGTIEQLTMWRSIMRPYDRAGIPYFAAVGNHDRKTPPGVPPGFAGLVPPGVQGSLDNYHAVFVGRPYPFGDGAPPNDPKFSPSRRPATDPAGASSHYFLDYGDVRWIFVDNSCWSITPCDASQRPSFPDAAGNRGQLEWLERTAGAARAAGKTTFVVMHMPTRDPRDQSYIDPFTFNHTMGKGFYPDNREFEEVAERSGVDGVFVGHIKGQFLYRGRGGVRGYIDGGAGGELYTEGPVGTDHGYWHGFRLVRVDRGRITTDVVPIFVPNGIDLRGAQLLAPGAEAVYTAFGHQPVFVNEAKVERLELRDPDPIKRTNAAGLDAFIQDGGWLFVPLILLIIGGLFVNGTVTLSRPGATLLCVVAGTAVAGTAGLSLAQQGSFTDTPKEALPSPARIFATSNPDVLAPVAARGDDPRRNPRTQTESGRFRARCPGVARVRVTSGFETTAHPVTVPSRRGRIVRSARVVAPRTITRGRRRTVARVRLAQPAEVIVRVRRRGRTLRTLRDRCSKGAFRAVWDGRVRARGKLRAAKAGRYRIEVRVRSDRRTLKRSRLTRVKSR